MAICGSLGRTCSTPRSSTFLSGTQVAPSRTAVAPQARVAITISARYRGYGTDLSKVQQFRRTETDVGSPEVQIAQLSARVLQLTNHLKENPKDFACKRGLLTILGTRKRHLRYLFKHDPSKFTEVVTELKIRNPLSH